MRRAKPITGPASQPIPPSISPALLGKGGRGPVCCWAIDSSTRCKSTGEGAAVQIVLFQRTDHAVVVRVVCVDKNNIMRKALEQEVLGQGALAGPEPKARQVTGK